MKPASAWCAASIAGLTAMVCIGCEPGECEAGPAEVELGTGNGAFAALEDGDEIELVHGFQGGLHTVMGLRLRGLAEPANVSMFGSIDGEQLADANVTAQGTCVEEGLVLTQLWLIWAADEQALHRAQATIEVEALGPDGAMATDELHVVIDDPWLD